MQLAKGRRLSFSVLTCCTAAKKPLPQPAEELYLGQQHRELMRGVYAFREANHGTLELKIVSAKHGLLRSDETIWPYDETFRDLTKAKLRDRSTALELPQKVAAYMEMPADVRLILLGRDYLEACAIDFTKPMTALTVMFYQPSSAHLVPRTENLLVVPLGNMDAQRHRCPLVAIKGRLAGRILLDIAQRAPRMKEAKAQ
jgi:hypothetical protein